MCLHPLLIWKSRNSDLQYIYIPAIVRAGRLELPTHRLRVCRSANWDVYPQLWADGESRTPDPHPWSGWCSSQLSYISFHMSEICLFLRENNSHACKFHTSAPVGGLEPPTRWLTVSCSTDWATPVHVRPRRESNPWSPDFLVWRSNQLSYGDCKQHLLNIKCRSLSEWPDSNRRPTAPHAAALTNWATVRTMFLTLLCLIL